MRLSRELIRFLLIQIVLVSSLSYIAISGMKLLFNVPRPCELLESCPDSFSFPSRHAGIAFAIATVFSLYVRRLDYRALAFALAALVGYWRIATGFHTVLDVAVGGAVGVIIGIFVYYLFQKFGKTSYRLKSFV